MSSHPQVDLDVLRTIAIGAAESPNVKALIELSYRRLSNYISERTYEDRFVMVDPPSYSPDGNPCGEIVLGEPKSCCLTHNRDC